MKKLYILLSLICVLLLLSSCFATQGNTGFTMPEAKVPWQAPVGDIESQYTRNVHFYLPERNSYKLVRHTEPIKLALSDRATQQIVEYILNFAGDDYLAAPNYGVQIGLFGENPVAVYSNHAVVNLTANALLLERSEFYLLASSIAETLIEFCGIESVNVLVADRAVSMDVLSNIPIGAIEKSATNAPYTDLLKMQEERDGLHRGIQAGDIPTSLFFPSNSGEGVLAEGRKVIFNSFAPEEMILQLMQELSNGPRYLANKVNIPNFVDLLSVPPQVEEWREGGNFVTLRFKSVFDDVIGVSSVHKNTAIAMLCYTISSFYPDTAGISVYIGGELVKQFLPDEIIDQEIYQTTVLISKRLLGSYLLKQSNLYFANIHNHQLEKTIRLLPNKMSLSPRNILLQLAQGPKELDYIINPTIPVVPFGMEDKDILGIALQGDTLCINLSAQVLQNLQAADAQTEKIFVYSIVNTLCNANPIKSILFFFDGKSIDTIHGELYWHTEFVPNLKLI